MAVEKNATVKYERTLFEPEHELFREAYRSFLERHVAPPSTSSGRRTRSSIAGSGSRPVSRASSAWPCRRSSVAVATPTSATT